jgi:predicted  nucleic acid-binding Zn-ribbon protein
MVRTALTGFATTLGLILALGGAVLGQNAAPAPTKTADDATAKPGPPSQRYRFSHTAEGVLRLDNETGQVVLCRALGNGWACNPAPDETAVLQIELNRKNAEVAKLSGEFAKLQIELDAQKTEVASLTARLAQQEAAGKDAISQDERRDLVSRIALLEQDNGGLKGALARLEADNANLKKQVAAMPQPPDLMPAVAQLLEANDALKHDLAATNRQIADLRKQMTAQDQRAAQQAEIAKLKDDNAALTDKLTALEIESARMQNEIAELKPPAPPAAVPSDKKDELKLPSREDMERARAALTDAWRRVIEMIDQLQKDITGNRGEPPVRL